MVCGGGGGVVGEEEVEGEEQERREGGIGKEGGSRRGGGKGEREELGRLCWCAMDLHVICFQDVVEVFNIIFLTVCPVGSYYIMVTS